jgi:hypothetical protein
MGKVMENKYSIKRIILDICSMKTHISKMKKSDKPYVSIFRISELNFIIL